MKSSPRSKFSLLFFFLFLRMMLGIFFSFQFYVFCSFIHRKRLYETGCFRLIRFRNSHPPAWKITRSSLNQCISVCVCATLVSFFYHPRGDGHSGFGARSLKPHTDLSHSRFRALLNYYRIVKPVQPTTL